MQILLFFFNIHTVGEANKEVESLIKFAFSSWLNSFEITSNITEVICGMCFLIRFHFSNFKLYLNFVSPILYLFLDIIVVYSQELPLIFFLTILHMVILFI